MKTEVATEKVTLTTTTVAEIVFNGDKDICNDNNSDSDCDKKRHRKE